MATALQTDKRSVRTFTREKIASLTPADIAKLTFDQMVEVVLASEISVRQLGPLREVDGDMLIRLVYSARSHCRLN